MRASWLGEDLACHDDNVVEGQNLGSNMTRILHTADWQIGRLFGSFDPADAVPLAEARFTTVEQVAALAARAQVDAVAVAGDVFDAQTVSARSIRKLFNAMEGYGGPWVLIPGNHDAALTESVWTHAARLGVLPPNVHLALKPQIIELAAPRIAFLCAPLTQRHTFEDLTDWFDTAVTPAGWLRVGVAHGAVQGVLAQEIDSANPISPDRAQRARLDYLALGDWHGTKCMNDRTWYSGTPEPDRFKSNDAGQALIVNFREPGSAPEVQKVSTGQYRWQQRVHTINVASDLDALIESLGESEARDVLDLTVTGRVDLVDQLRLKHALDATEGRVRCLRRDLSGLQLAPTADDIASLQADGYLGEVIEELRSETRDTASQSQDALAILTGLLAERAAKRVAA